MGLFPTNAVNGQQVTNANGTTFEYVEVDNKWIIVVRDIVISDTPYDATGWNDDLDGASKNVIRDEMETKLANVVEDASPQFAANLDCQEHQIVNCSAIDADVIKSSTHAYVYTYDHFRPSTHKTRYLGQDVKAWDEAYADNWHNVGGKFIESSDLYQRYKDMKIEAHPNAKNSVGDAEIDVAKLIPEIYQPDRYEKQYVRDRKRELKKQQEDMIHPDDMTPQRLGTSLNQWILVNCMIIKELMVKNETLEARILQLESK